MVLPFDLGAGLCAAIALLLARPDPAWLARHRLAVAPSMAVRWPGMVAALAACLIIPGLLGLVRGPSVLLVTLTASCAGLFAVHQLRRSRLRASAEQSRREITEAIDVLAAELRAGLVPQRALAVVAVDLPALAPCARVAALGGDVPEIMRLTALRPGCGGLSSVAGAWQLSAECGAPLAHVLDRVAIGQRFETELGDEVRSAVEPARATGRLMAVLPLLGLFLGAGLGADPVGVITGTLGGSLCLAAGAALACLGVWWIDVTAERAERR